MTLVADCFVLFHYIYVFNNVAILDGLVKKLEELEKTADMYKGMMDHTKKLLKSFFDLSQAHKGKTCPP